MVDYRLGDLLEMGMLQKLADSNFSASGLPMTIVDAIDLTLLVKAGWPEICDSFHRNHPISAQRCRLSDSYVSHHLGDDEILQYRCENGLWHIAIPIVVGGSHLATLFLTQFFFEGELPDREYFRCQAQELGYDVDAYLAAIDAMPVFSLEKVEYIVAYDKALVRFIAELAERSLHVVETRQSLSDSEEKYRTLVNNVNIGVYRCSPDGTFHQVNPAMARIFGFRSPEELCQVNVSNLYQLPTERERFLDDVKRDGFVKDRELAMHKLDDTLIWCAVTATAHQDEAGEILWLDCAMEDITERKRAQEELQQAHDELEVRVLKRTAELAKANELLRVEIAERKRVEKRLRELSEVDPLTAIFNRRTLFELLAFEVDKSKRHQRPLALLLFDLDHFKRVNDSFGHHVGDAVLKATVNLVNSLIRRSDVFARYGGEEFIIVMPETDHIGAMILAEKLRRAIEACPFPIAGRVTISVGVAEYSGDETDSSLVHRADQALYTAKRGGRNRVETAEPKLCCLAGSEEETSEDQA